MHTEWYTLAEVAWTWIVMLPNASDQMRLRSSGGNLSSGEFTALRSYLLMRQRQPKTRLRRTSTHMSC